MADKRASVHRSGGASGPAAGTLPPVTILWCEVALTAAGFQTGVRLEVSETGRVAAIEPGGPDGAERLGGLVLPGMPNLHSHAFQRALVGRTERPGPAEDSFWTWRESMYAVAGRIDESELERVAIEVFAEMVEAGYTSVAEFHYLHHRPDGTAHPQPAAMGRTLARAASQVGLRMTLVPALYLQGGFGAPPERRQARFVARDVGSFLRLLEDARSIGVPLGVAAHSLRAVPPEAFAELLVGVSELLGPVPFHVHVAEQPAEVQACLHHHRLRPLELLLDRFDVGPGWCLVHATHATDAELTEAARRGAVAGLCPTTEANLGDGRFSAEVWMEAGGRFGIGTDSQVTVDPAEELRWLEYQARLSSGARARLFARDRFGRAAWCAAVAGGRAALGEGGDGIAVGEFADLVCLDREHPRLQGLEPDDALDAFLLGARAIASTYVGGKKVAERGQALVRPGPKADLGRGRP